MHHEMTGSVPSSSRRCLGCPVTLTEDELPGRESDAGGLCVRCAESVF